MWRTFAIVAATAVASLAVGSASTYALVTTREQRVRHRLGVSAYFAPQPPPIPVPNEDDPPPEPTNIVMSLDMTTGNEQFVRRRISVRNAFATIREVLGDPSLRDISVLSVLVEWSYWGQDFMLRRSYLPADYGALSRDLVCGHSREELASIDGGVVDSPFMLASLCGGGPPIDVTPLVQKLAGPNGDFFGRTARLCDELRLSRPDDTYNQLALVTRNGKRMQYAL